MGTQASTTWLCFTVLPSHPPTLQPVASSPNATPTRALQTLYFPGCADTRDTGVFGGRAEGWTKATQAGSAGPVRLPACPPACDPACQPACPPACQTAKQPASQPASHPASRIPGLRPGELIGIPVPRALPVLPGMLPPHGEGAGAVGECQGMLVTLVSPGEPWRALVSLVSLVGLVSLNDLEKGARAFCPPHPAGQVKHVSPPAHHSHPDPSSSLRRRSAHQRAGAVTSMRERARARRRAGTRGHECAEERWSEQNAAGWREGAEAAAGPGNLAARGGGVDSESQIRPRRPGLASWCGPSPLLDPASGRLASTVGTLDASAKEHCFLAPGRSRHRPGGLGSGVCGTVG